MVVETVCALTTVSRVAAHVFALQHERYLAGEFVTFPWLGNLIRVYAYISYGICDKTKTLKMTEMPDLTRDLGEIPTEYRLPIVTAIRFEQTGRGHPKRRVTRRKAS